MTTETFKIATRLNTEIEQLNTRLKDLLQLKQNIDKCYGVHIRLFSDVGTDVSINDRELIKPIIETLIERTNQSIFELSKKFNKL